MARAEVEERRVPAARAALPALGVPAAAVEVPAAVAAAGAGDLSRCPRSRRNADGFKNAQDCSLRIRSALAFAAVFCSTGVLSSDAQQPKQRAFDTPEAAVEALIQAAGAYDVPALLDILGPQSKDLVGSEDPVQDKGRAVVFAALASEKQMITVDPKNSSWAGLSVGNDDWPFPIPIVKRNQKWYYDTEAGRQEILFRRIGENELDAIQICRGFVEAQKEYALESRGDSELHEYAQRIISTPGKHDGLAWQNPDGSWGGPVGEAVAKALEEGYAPDRPPVPRVLF